MTTGLQKVVAVDRVAREPALAPRVGRLHELLRRFRGRVHLLTRRTARRPAPRARDVHDTAVLRGVFPPRV
jgi:hypothetical protein